MAVKKIGIYVSAFDPIHDGHLEFATSAIIQNNLDKLYFLVEPSPKHKQGVKALNHRINMVILGLSDHPSLGTIVTKSYDDIDSNIKLLQKRFKYHKLLLIIPEAAVNRYIKQSHLFSQSSRNFEIVIGLSSSDPSEINHKLNLLSQTSGRKVRYKWFNSIAPTIKSASIKKQLRLGHKPNALPKTVYEYIIKQKLYLPASSA